MNAVAVSFDHLVGGGEERRGYLDPNRPGGFEVGDRPEFCNLLDWDVAGVRPPENLVDEYGRMPDHHGKIGSRNP